MCVLWWSYHSILSKNILQLLQTFTIELLYYIYIFAYISERSRKFVWHVDWSIDRCRIYNCNIRRTEGSPVNIDVNHDVNCIVSDIEHVVKVSIEWGHCRWYIQRCFVLHSIYSLYILYIVPLQGQRSLLLSNKRQISTCFFTLNGTAVREIMKKTNK